MLRDFIVALFILGSGSILKSCFWSSPWFDPLLIRFLTWWIFPPNYYRWSESSKKSIESRKWFYFFWAQLWNASGYRISHDLKKAFKSIRLNRRRKKIWGIWWKFLCKTWKILTRRRFQTRPPCSLRWVKWKSVRWSKRLKQSVIG